MELPLYSKIVKLVVTRVATASFIYVINPDSGYIGFKL